MKKCKDVQHDSCLDHDTYVAITVIFLCVGEKISGLRFSPSEDMLKIRVHSESYFVCIENWCLVQSRCWSHHSKHVVLCAEVSEAHVFQHKFNSYEERIKYPWNSGFSGDEQLVRCLWSFNSPVVPLWKCQIIYLH